MNWKKVNVERWFCYDNNGAMLKGWVQDNGKWYYCHQDEGYRMTGLIQVKDKTYLLDGGGIMLTGWQKIEGKDYYFNTDGSMVKGWLELENKKYYMHQDDGHMMQGWIVLGDKTYCANTDGTIITNGFHTLCGKLYYFNKDGVLLEKDRKLKGKVTASVLNVRDAMTTDSNIIGTLNKDQIVTVGLEYTSNLDWFSIYFGNNGGFISSKYIEILENQDECEVSGDSLVSDNVVEFVKSYEGFSATPYRGADSQNLTLGYGTTNHCSARWLFDHVPVSKELATKALKEEINMMAKKIKADLNSKGVSLKQNEFDSLCSFAYNCGEGALLNQATLYRKVCDGVRDESLRQWFTAWSKCNGQTLVGLKNRREEECDMFLYGDYNRDK